VREAAQRLSHYGLARLASGHSSRAIKYRHLAEEALGLGREQLAILAVLLLREAQTPGELKSRSERLAPLGSLADVERVLAELGERGYVRRLDRRPGQKEDRFEHLLGATAAITDRDYSTAFGDGVDRTAGLPAAGPAAESNPVPGPAAESNPVPGGLEARVAALESKLARLQAELAQLRTRDVA
jgi:hypothetical protein